MSWNDPPASSPEVAARMRAVKTRDTGPELAIRRLVHAAGLRYLVDAPLPIEGARRRSDMSFTRRRVAVFVDGCYWHGCPAHFRPSGVNRDWWLRKIERTRARDTDTDRRLAEAGWTVVRVWEHEDPADAAARVIRAVRNALPLLTLLAP